jgi:DNA adenine methylase
MQKPFIKWVGGKTQLIDKVIENTPKEFNNYHEPFLGGGSVLLAVLSLQRENKITINGDIYAYDYNARLINMYKQIQSYPEIVYNTLKSYIDDYNASDDKELYYYNMRADFNRMDRLSYHQASRFIFLNKTCFRGLYRENKQGKLNVAYGHYVNPGFPALNELLQISDLIKDVKFQCCDFTDALNEVSDGDYVYLDPPYAPENNKSFTSYNSSGFTLQLHETLFQAIHEIHDTGALFSMSNHAVPLVLDNFNEFKCVNFEAKRKINSKKPQSKTTEVIISNVN